MTLGDLQSLTAEPAGQDAMARIAPIAKETIRASVYAELKRAVLSGVFAPGEVVVARLIAERMDTGLMPVRESMQQLVTEGAFEILPNRGVGVPVLDAARLREIFEIRIKLEAMAAEKAAASITDAELDALRLCAARVTARPASMEAASAALAANFEFHFRIYEAARSPALYTIIERLWLRVGPLLIRRFRHPEQGDLAPSLEQHERLLDALERRDGSAAAAAIECILNLSWRWYEKTGLAYG